MSNGSAARRSDDTFVRGANRLAEWIEEYDEALVAMVEMRNLGRDGRAALHGLLEVPRIKRMRLAWELWQHYAWLEGVDTEPYLTAAIPGDRLFLARMALWGRPGPRIAGL